MVNAFSFCLYGPPNPRYYVGLLENIEMIRNHFADWVVYVYVGADVDTDYIENLRTYSHVRLRETGLIGHMNSPYRFFAIDEPGVDLMFVRDADSRVHWKDRWAIKKFMDSGYGSHMVRDHKCHDMYMLAGLWGLRKGVLETPLRTMFEQWTPTFAGSGHAEEPTGFGVDQNFLKLEVYPRIVSNLYVTYSHTNITNQEAGIAFPFEWNNDVYCGKIEDSNYSDIPQPQVVVHEVRKSPGQLFVNFLHKK